MSRHINIPIFIPHLGCPNDCVFCNQRSISGKMSFDESKVKDEIENAISTLPEGAETEIAFFGGSFTGIDRGLMIRLLETARGYIDKGQVTSIRLSTRPDYISEDILDILKKYGVKAIELGIQSMDERVLAMSKRGHTVRDTENACRLVKEYGFSLVGQMMTGLPFSTPDAEVMTARRICELGADGSRIYPTMVFHGTELERMAERGIYTPPTLEDTVSRTARVFGVFVKNHIPILRIGLHSGENLYKEDGISMGAYHPAMGELVIGEYYYKIIKEKLEEQSNALSSLTVLVPVGCLSKAIGQRGKNRDRLKKEFSLREISFKEDEGINLYEVRLSEPK